VGGACRYLDGFLGELEGGLDVAGGFCSVTSSQGQIAVRVALRLVSEQALRSPGPGGSDRSLADIGVVARDSKGEIGGPYRVTFGDAGLEGSFVNFGREVGVRGEEGGLAKPLEIGARQLAISIGL
jgi:hypothetical protein